MQLEWQGWLTLAVVITCSAALGSLIATSAGSFGAMPALVVRYFTALLMAEMLHHSASVAILFPIAVASAGCRAFAWTIGHQTRLIVQC